MSSTSGPEAKDNESEQQCDSLGIMDLTSEQYAWLDSPDWLHPFPSCGTTNTNTSNDCFKSPHINNMNHNNLNAYNNNNNYNNNQIHRYGTYSKLPASAIATATVTKRIRPPVTSETFRIRNPSRSPIRSIPTTSGLTETSLSRTKTFTRERIQAPTTHHPFSQQRVNRSATFKSKISNHQSASNWN